MTPEQVIALGTSFAVFLRLFEGCIAYQPTVAHLHRASAHTGQFRQDRHCAFRVGWLKFSV